MVDSQNFFIFPKVLCFKYNARDEKSILFSQKHFCFSDKLLFLGLLFSMNTASSSRNVDNVSTKMKKLEDIERKICTAIQSAGLTLQELGKDKPNDKGIDKHTLSFTQSLEDVEIELAKQINYLSQVATNQQHEGSSYASQYRQQISEDVLSMFVNEVDSMLAICGRNTGMPMQK